MKRRYLYALPLALAVAAFSGQSVAEDCKAPDPIDDKNCTGDPQAPKVEISVDDNGINVTPMCVRTYKGKILVFSVKQEDHIKGETIEVFAKDDFDTWLKGKNDKNERHVFLTIPGTHKLKEKGKPSTNHDYGVRYKGLCLDPRIKVER